MRIDRERLAWAAGFFDGEGCCSCKSTRPQVIISLGQTNLERLLKFRDTFGLGAIYGPIRRKNPNWATLYYFSAGSFEEAQAIIAMLWLWLSSDKKRQAIRALRRYRAYQSAQPLHMQRRTRIRTRNTYMKRAQLRLLG